MQLNKAFILLFLFLVSANVYGQDEIRFSIYFEGDSYAIDKIQEEDFF
jgi:hypothetical protein